jgi:two-component system, sensor histidine kinase and response regulator
VIIDASGQMLLTNRKLSDISGYSVGELAGQNVDMLVPAKVRGHHQAHRDGYFTNPVSRKLDERVGLALQRKDGTQFPVAISLNPIQSAQGVIIAASIRDVSEQRAYEGMLIDSKARMTMALQSGDMEAYELDMEKNLVQSDCNLYRRFGYPAPDSGTEGWVNDPWVAIVHPDDRERLVAAVGKFVRGEIEHYSNQYRVLAHDGAVRWIETNGIVTAHDANGLPRKIVGVRRDVTRLKESELVATEKLRELEEFNKLAVGRELRMIELKQEINTLLAQQGSEDKYEIV